MRDYKLVIAIIFGSLVLAFIGYRMAVDVEPTGCSPDGFPGRCYHVTQSMCESLWKSSEASCKASVQGLSLPVGRLVGPIVFKCQLAALDETFKFSRKSTQECNEMHKDVEAWKRSNDIR